MLTDALETLLVSIAELLVPLDEDVVLEQAASVMSGTDRAKSNLLFIRGRGKKAK